MTFDLDPVTSNVKLRHKTLSGLDLCNYKQEEFQTSHGCSYHGLVVPDLPVTFDLDPVTSNVKVGHKTLSGLDLCNYKQNEFQTAHSCSYHGLVVQCHGQTWLQPLTLTLCLKGSKTFGLLQSLNLFTDFYQI